MMKVNDSEKKSLDSEDEKKRRKYISRRKYKYDKSIGYRSTRIHSKDENRNKTENKIILNSDRNKTEEIVLNIHALPN